MWHVYGEQADSPMNRLIDQFNETVGKEKGIIIDVTVVTNSVRLGPQLLDAHANKPGAPTMPDLFSSFPGIVKQMGVEHVLDWQDYFSDEELSHFVKEFLADGVVEDHLAVFPVSKSSYALFINGSQFDRFSAVGMDSLTPLPSTMNGQGANPSVPLTICSTIWNWMP